MQTLAIVDGDLVLAGSSHLTLNGPNKIKQDLYFALHEAYGADPYHPLWGTTLDKMLGLPLTEATRQSVLNEVNRVLNNYVAVQIDQINSHFTEDTRSNWNTSDVIRSVDSIHAISQGPQVHVSVALSTRAGQQVNVSVSSL